jgi:hypothetical protein
VKRCVVVMQQPVLLLPGANFHTVTVKYQSSVQN